MIAPDEESVEARVRRLSRESVARSPRPDRYRELSERLGARMLKLLSEDELERACHGLALAALAADLA